ncbi:MAG TPA: hypothetical protein PL181_17080 [bacterium]|nr:hypothetical protein [bacterium]
MTKQRVIEYARPQIKAVTATDEEWELIKSFMVRPDEFKPEDVRTYKFHLAHNFVDRDGERFTSGTLAQFAKTIVGKEFLIAHSWGPPGEGKFYGAEVLQVSIDEAMGIASDHPDPEGLRKQLERITGIDGQIAFLDVKMYMPSDSPWARKIDLGINTHVSIGFSAGRPAEVLDENSVVLWREYKFQGGAKRTEALEGSLVFLGSQYGAGSKKQPDEGDSEMIKVKIFGREFDLDSEKPESLKALTDAAESMQTKATEAEGKLVESDKNLKAVTAELDALKTAVGDVEKAKAAQALAGEYIDSLVEETLKMGGLAGLIDQDKVEERRTALKASTVPQIKERLAEYQKVFKAAHPQAGELADNAGGSAKDVKVVMGGQPW